MIYELKDFNTIINLNYVTVVRIDEGSHRYSKYDYGFFKKIIGYDSYLELPVIKVFIHGRENAANYGLGNRKEYKPYRDIDTKENQEMINNLLSRDYDELHVVYEKLKKAMEDYAKENQRQNIQEIVGPKDNS